MSLGEVYLVAFALGAGASIAGFWIVVLVTGRLDALIAPRRAARHHVAAELLTAGLLLAAGIALLLAGEQRWTDVLAGLAFGTLTYALLGSPGLYEDRRVMAAFAVGWAFTFPALVALFAGI